MDCQSQGLKKYTAEFIGTFALVFAGTGAIIINDISGGSNYPFRRWFSFWADYYDNDLCLG